METKVYAAIAAVTEEMAKEGIAKNRRNTQGSGYNFRGIDDVYNALAPLLAKHKLCILPNVLSREQVERESKSGGALFYTTVTVRFDFVSAEDGSKHEVTTCGEAMDSGDKSTNKAMSAAYKYAAFQAFCIPTEGDNDADASTHEPKPRPKPVGTKDPAIIETFAKAMTMEELGEAWKDVCKLPRDQQLLYVEDKEAAKKRIANA